MRIMIPLPNRRKSNTDNAETPINTRRAHPMPNDTRQWDAGLTTVVDARSDLTELIRAWPSLSPVVRAKIIALMRSNAVPK